MSENHFIQTAINKEKSFRDDLINSLYTLFDKSVMTNLYSDEIRDVKYFETKDFIYVLEKLNKGNAIKAYMVRHDENESVEYLLEYGLDNMKAKQNKIYGFPLVISNQRNTHNFYSDEMIELMEAFVNKLNQEGKDSKDIEEMLASFTEMKKQETSKDVETCYYLYKIVYLNKFLNTMTGMKIYDEDFFKGLMVEAKNQAFKFLEDLKVKRTFLELVCKKESFTKSEPFTFNDLDNHVWMEDDILLVDDQCSQLYFVGNKDTFTVYFVEAINIEGDKTKERFETSLRNSNVDFFKHVVLVVKNGEIEYADGGLPMNVLMSNMEYSTNSMISKGLGSPVYNVDITKYDYQKKYFFTKYKIKEIDFIFNTFLINGSGQSYNSNKGNIYYKDISYLEDLKIEEDPENELSNKVYTLFSTKNMLDEITYLNQDWLNAFEKLVKLFNDNEILSLVFNNDEEKQRNEYILMVKYLNKKLKSLKKTSINGMGSRNSE